MKKTLLLGTRKGLIVLRKKTSGWAITNSHFHGIPVTIAYVDSRNSTWWACLDHGHWGVKLHRSVNEGASWEEVPAPTYPEGSLLKNDKAATLQYIWAMQQGGLDDSNRIWMGTIPGGLFQSNDNGNTWSLNAPLWNHPSRIEHWFGGGFDQAGIHSIVIDPRNEQHIYIGVSCAGVFETEDSGKTWAVRNTGLRADFLPNPSAEVGHDPHVLVAAPSNPDVLWQQNHCGIFVSHDGAASWKDVSEKNGPANFGFALAVADDNPNQAWVAPAISDFNRIPVNNAFCICRTDDGGRTWTEFRKGLPQKNAFDIVYRHALQTQGDELVCGTTTGNLFYSNDRGESWQVISNYLPMIHSIQFAI